MRIWLIANGLNIVLLQSLLVLVALVACVFAAEQDQEAAEQYFFKYGYYPSWYTSATHFAAPASTFKAYPSYAYSYPGYHYGAYPYSYFPGHYAAPVAAVAEKKDLKLATISFTFPTNKFRKNNHSSIEIYKRQEEKFDSQI